MTQGAHSPGPAGSETQGQRVFVFNGGFVSQRRVRRILQLAGYRVSVGNPGQNDTIAVWGKSPTSGRGEAMAAKSGAAVLRVEDAWLRSLFPGRVAKEPPIGLLLDKSGVHFDPSRPSDLENLLAQDPLDDTAILDRARQAIDRFQEAGLTKYTAFDPDADTPPPGYVLVLDQTRDDAAVTASDADRNRFLEMLYWAQEDHPGAPVLIKSHPETAGGHRWGYFSDADAQGRVSFCPAGISPQALFEGAIAVYTVSSQMGFEAIFAGHKPRVFGQPFYAGWGLTEDAFPLQRRQRKLTRAQLFAGAMLKYPAWYDPHRDCLCDYETAAEALIAETRAWREDRHGYVASGMRLWKRKSIAQHFGRFGKVRFVNTPTRAEELALKTGARQIVWATKAAPEEAWETAIRVEDGFLRSKGLGAKLTPALSLVSDPVGIYYDARKPSRLERLIEQRAVLRADQKARAEGLIARINSLAVTKYNFGGAATDLPTGHKILVPGQVEDDASIRFGTSEIATNLGLLEHVRAQNPDATIIYKPHPDVEVGLRPGKIDAASLADLTITDVDPTQLFPMVNEVWTMTSLLGFEALLRGVSVTTLGAPFYAGWGLTTDLGAVPPRRRHDVRLEGLVHAALIDYPRYLDPVTGTPCTVEVAIERLAEGRAPRGPVIAGLSKLQGFFASYAHLWRQ